VKPPGQTKLIYMIRRIDLRESDAGGVRVTNVVPRAATNVADATKTVIPILEDIRQNGAEAVARWSLTLDGITPPSLRVPAAELDKAAANLDPAVRSALLESIRRARIVHSDQVRGESVTEVVAGGTVTERWIPVDRVGLYVPGGQAVYPSSVIMNVVPAQIAGVGSIAVVSPPQKDWGGWPHPVIMAACHLLGIEEVYSVGGAQAVAMLAYGVKLPTGECQPVDLVTGPGNIYVTAAKRALQGVIGIDSEAGPTEILILADDTADPAHVAADLISQAEHDELAAAVLVTASEPLAQRLLMTTRQSTWKYTLRMRARWRAESHMPVQSSSERTPPYPWVITALAPTMFCPRRVQQNTHPAYQCRPFCAEFTSLNTRGRL